MKHRTRNYEGHTPEETLRGLVEEIYQGKPEEMIRDMEDRINRKPFILGLVARLQEDILRVRKMYNLPVPTAA